MSNLWIILCVLFSYSQTDSQTIHIVEHKSDWFTASQTCTRQQGRLPSVNIYDHRLQLKDLSDTKNISSPFWVAATYDNMSYNHCEPHHDLCPDTLCQTIAMSSGNIHIEWRPCWECNNFYCAYSLNEIYEEVDWKWECKDWPGAFQYCKERNARLATRDNVPFLERVANSMKSFWLDDVPHSNLAPYIGIQNRTCLYSFNGIIHDGDCSDTSITTVCILVSTKFKTTAPSTMLSFQRLYTTGMIPTTSNISISAHNTYDSSYCHSVSISVKTTDITSTSSTVFPSQTVFTTGMAHIPEYSITNQPVITVSENGLNTTEQTSEKQTKGIWPILGSALGGLVIIIIVVLIIIIVLRRRRQDRSHVPDLPKKEHISMHQSRDDTCYETLDQNHSDSANVYCALTPTSAVRKD